MSSAKLPKRDARGAAPQRRRVRVGRVARLPGIVMLVAALGATGIYGQEPDVEILSVLADMVGQKHRFKPDRLHAMGVDGLSAVLDELLPDTAVAKKISVPEETILKLIGQLGDKNFRVRETASEKLRQLGPGVNPFLIEAARSTDAEVSWRARRILRQWESRRKEDKGRYLQALAVYLSGIEDDERLRELAERTLMGVEQGRPSGSRSQILRQCMTAIARSGKDQYTSRFGPLLDHEDVGVAVLVTRAIGAAVDSSCCPTLFLDALESGRPEVVAAAISYAQNCGDNPRKAEIKDRLISIFQRDDPSQKLQATMPLLYAFDYAQAMDYLLEQVKSGDPSRQSKALSCIGNSRNRGKPAGEKLLATLVPLLKSDEKNMRRMASRALGTYCGEEVVRNLIPLLADQYVLIPREVKRTLRQQPDQKMVRRVLAAAAKENQDKNVRKAAAELFEELGGQQ